MDKVLQELVPIGLLILVVSIVVTRLPKVDVGHTAAFRRRRVLNWLPLGLTYAFLYMGRYNFNALMDHKLISQAEFGHIDAVGSVVYGLSFLLNGPLTDRFGGRLTILLAAAGAAACNGAIGIAMLTSSAPLPADTVPAELALMVLYGLNMYFQSFGAVAIVKVNASWFHLRERGTFGGIFGILISVGLYLAYDWAPKIAELTSWPWLFLAPTGFLLLFFGLSYLFVRDTPADAGLADFDVADASSGETGPPDRALVIIKRMLTNKVLLVIAFISLCSGFMRQGILKWYRTFANGVGHIIDDKTGATIVGKTDAWIPTHWGMVSCIAGITGGMFAGIVSDHLFKSRRPPVACVAFGLLLGGAIAIVPLLDNAAVISGIAAFMAMAVIGVHGMMSGVASQDFGGRRNAGTATGLIDGFVYFGGAFSSIVYGAVLPEKGTPAAADTHAWLGWPLAMIPLAVIGLGLSLTILKAVVAPRKPSLTTAAPK